MSSKEIADLTGKLHSNVLRDCYKLNNNYLMINEQSILSCQEDVKMPHGGYKKVRVLRLNKRQCLDLLTGYNTILRIKVNRRWEELEKGASLNNQLPTDYLSALKALVVSEEQKQLALHEAQQQKQLAVEAIDLAEDLEKDIEKIKPQAEYCEKVLKSKDTYLTSEIADELGMSATKLNKVLRTNKVQYKTSGSRWMLYQQHRDKGYTDTKTAEYYTKENEVRTSSNMVWTEKGRMFIHELLNNVIEDLNSITKN